MKSVLIIGMGRFGRHMAQKLYDLGHDVLAIDKSEAKINKVLSYVTNAQIGDSTDESFVDSLGVSNFDLCVVAIGDDFQSSLETTALLKDHGSKLVVARAVRDVHAKFLLRNGADEVVYPEKQIGNWAAVRFSSENIFDYVQLTPEYSIYEIAVPRDWIGKTPAELDVRKHFKINIVALRQDNSIAPLEGADHVFRAQEHMMVLGRSEDVFRLAKD